MLFNSPEYIFAFLPLVLAVYFLLNRARLLHAGKGWLVAASLFFYGWWNPAYLGLIIGSIGINYTIGRRLARRAGQRWLLTIGLLLNLGLLAGFKYADFFIANLNWALGGQIPALGLLLPLAISFFTFQQIAFLVDCHRQEAGEHDLLDYALFVTFFPQLIAGPIVHHREMMPQFARLRNRLADARNLALGLFVFAIGLFKKLFIADTLAPWADAGFAAPGVLTLWDAWGTALAYTFQLYYDFSGYTDMAIGAALMFNIRLPVNFDSPYRASDIRDFWRRWHITLSRWLRDYLYIPLGGNRRGELRTYRNLLLTFLLGGLWHGAGWTFVAWGALHGIALSIHRLWSGIGLRMPGWLGWPLTFLFVVVTWVFFRATDFDSALRLLQGMAGMGGVAVSPGFAGSFNYLSGWPFLTLTGDPQPLLLPIDALEYLLLAGLGALLLPNSVQMAGLLPYRGLLVFRPTLGRALLTAAALTLALGTLIGDVAPSAFLYFNF